MLAHSGKENYDTPAALDNTTASDIFQHLNSILFFFSRKGRKLVEWKHQTSLGPVFVVLCEWKLK